MLYKEKAVIRWDDEQKICSVAIKQKIPFIGSSWFKIYSYRQMKYHDYTGKSMVYEGDGTEEFVYITEHGRVYHKQQKCVYLYMSYSKCSISKCISKEMLPVENMVSVKVVAVMWN